MKHSKKTWIKAETKTDRGATSEIMERAGVSNDMKSLEV